MRPKWRYVFSQVEDVENVQEPIVDPNSLKEEVLDILRKSPDQLQTNPAALSALEKCLSYAENGYVESNADSILECVKETLKNSGNGEIYKAIDDFLSGQPMSSIDPDSWNKRRIQDPFRGFKNPNI